LIREREGKLRTPLQVSGERKPEGKKNRREGTERGKLREKRLVKGRGVIPGGGREI